MVALVNSTRSRLTAGRLKPVYAAAGHNNSEEAVYIWMHGYRQSLHILSQLLSGHHMKAIQAGPEPGEILTLNTHGP